MHSKWLDMLPTLLLSTPIDKHTYRSATSEASPSCSYSKETRTRWVSTPLSMLNNAVLSSSLLNW